MDKGFRMLVSGVTGRSGLGARDGGRIGFLSSRRKLGWRSMEVWGGGGNLSFGSIFFVTNRLRGKIYLCKTYFPSDLQSSFPPVVKSFSHRGLSSSSSISHPSALFASENHARSTTARRPFSIDRTSWYRFRPCRFK